MSTITKERIELFIKSPLENGLTRGEQMELARIALASLELERGIIRRFDLDMSGCDSFGQDCGADMVEDLDGEYVLWDDVLPHLYRYDEYTATPSTVSVPDAATAIRACIDEFPESVRDIVEECASIAENACRAAMLHGAEPVSQTYKLNELSGNSPVTPGGWISCSDRMPEDTKMLLAFSQGEIVAAYWNWVVNPIDYKKYRAFTYLSGNILDDVTHWMPLPEPPL
ncbi:TPA: DUF551 domain-containing protein [Escherichia coli]|nr:DUF551 domain-containing protein [Escherichia coli]HAJ6814777.1 DUF551 domain-containing protein [Escherichia coli]HAN6624954.1 DUF551 domain-containing protein [Escherichia coli]HCQ3683717.1 DUF551 domain-containing protein [Escherichia coli]HDY0866208.1 DUF551 domain-containing protein [Escherichia coli]